MRKKQKKQIIELLHTMIDGEKEVLGLVSPQEKVALLEDCQNAAIQVGESIEKSEGEGTQAVAYLEEYCEVVFQTSKFVTEENQENTNLQLQNQVEKLGHLLQTVENAVHDLPNTLEVVFFPYKASMWDSLESIWLAFKEKPNCHAAVVPIPYVDRNPDGSVKEEHYEINQYPTEIPVIDYHDYNLDDEQPDIAFIHNPYDGNNLVTSVHPNYYSYNLKQKVGKLVYVPYLALGGNLDKNASDFSAYHHVDYIVTQTPNHRLSFPLSLPEDMFLPFGSPKFDAIIEKCKSPKPVPDAWKQRMYGKKVFFYNTSIRCAINEPEDYLKKMGEVFKAFAEHKEVCLVWRPHPLLEATFDSMLPEYAEVYRKLRRLYISQEIGIYDDTPCMEDTISWCDAYIGDLGTTVVSSFSMAGKPIYVLNNLIHTNEEEKEWKRFYYKLLFDPSGDDRWIVTWQDELWYSANNDYHYKYVCRLVEAYDTEYHSYYLCAKEYKGRVYIIPANSQDVLVYENGCIRKIELEKEGEAYGSFVSGTVRGKYLWLWPMAYPAIVRIDLETEEIVYEKEARNFQIRRIGNTIQRGSSSFLGRNVLFGSPDSNDFMYMDMESLQKEYFSLPLENWKGTSSAGVERYAYKNECKDEYFWIFPNEGYDIYRCDVKRKVTHKYHVQPEGFYCRTIPDGDLCDYRPFVGNLGLKPGKVLLSPWQGNHFIELDISTGESKIWDSPHTFRHDVKSKDFMGVGGITGVEHPEVQHGIVRLSNINSYCLVEYNLNTGTAEELHVEFDLDDLERLHAGFIKRDGIYYCAEDQFNGLAEMITGEIKGNAYNKEYQRQNAAEINASMDGECGKRVCDYLYLAMAGR